MRIGLALALLLSGCSSPFATASGDDAPGAALEQAAIARGVIRDPAALVPTGLYAREGDRLCVAGQSDESARIGTFIDYGDGIGCTARGRWVQDGDRLKVDFGGDCRFTAAFDGEQVRVPGALPRACERLCTRRASLAGLSLDRLSDSESEAQALRDPAGKPLCG